jgi:hypothetical protein
MTNGTAPPATAVADLTGGNPNVYYELEAAVTLRAFLD